MGIIEIIILGIVQGITEFVPVSSSGHLVITQELLQANTTLAFDVALHAGTLLALLLFFRKDFWLMLKALFVKSEHTKTALLIIVATIPAALVGFFIEGFVESKFRSSRLVAINLIVVALLIFFIEKQYKNRKQHTSFKNISLKQALIIGGSQTAALFPGVSRSGSTILAGIATGLDRVTALRFSFLMSAPIIFGALLKTMLLDAGLSELSGNPSAFLIGITTAFLSGIIAISFLMRYVRNHSLAAFAYYRIVVGLLVIVWTTLR